MSPVSAQANKEPVNLLLVDDRPDGLLALEVALRAPDYRFIKAASGEEALRWLLEHDDDIAVILMDVQMPRLDGFETASLIKMQERHRHVPIIFVTGIHGDPRFVNQGYEAGAIDYVTKPYQPYHLRSKVAVLVDLHRKTRLVNEMVAREHEQKLAEAKRQLEEDYVKRLGDSERRFRTLASCAPVGIFFTDPQGACLFTNARWQELTGISNEEACALGGSGWMRAIHPDERERLAQEWQTMVLTGTDLEAQCRMICTAGQLRWVYCRTKPLHDDNGLVAGYIGSIVDITERVRTEETLRSAAEALTRSNAELQRFAWIASHDLKEPLRMVASYVRLLERKYKGKLGPEADDYIRFAVEGAQRMYSLVDGILHFSGVDRCAQPSRVVDCNDIFDSAVASLQVTIVENGAIVERAKLPEVVADSVQLGQLFQNLIANSLKFRGKETPRIYVGAELVGTEWRFRFRDNGIGIDPQFNEKIFGVFQRLHTQDQYPGMGVGLAICKKIVEKHGGRIWVESAPGEGATFFFSLPVVAAPSQAAIGAA